MNPSVNPNKQKIEEVLSLIDSEPLKEFTRTFLNSADEKMIEIVRQAQLQSNDFSKMLEAQQKKLKESQDKILQEIALVCSNCTKNQAQLSSTAQKLDKCSGCKIAYYCSKDCQRKDWATHKNFCLKNRK